MILHKVSLSTVFKCEVSCLFISVSAYGRSAEITLTGVVSLVYAEQVFDMLTKDKHGGSGCSCVSCRSRHSAPKARRRREYPIGVEGKRYPLYLQFLSGQTSGPLPPPAGCQHTISRCSESLHLVRWKFPSFPRPPYGMHIQAS
jgi:hypothetical protein